MKFTTRILLLSFLLTLIVVLQYIFGRGRVSAYNHYIFQPFQALRNGLFKKIPFSVGDVLYVVVALWLLYGLYRIIQSCWQWRTKRASTHHRLLQFFKVLAVAYLWFFLGWGGNYWKPSLVKYWQLDALKTKPVEALRRYDSFLVSRLNVLAPSYREENFEYINHQSRLYYAGFTEDRSRFSGLQAKPSLFGYYMQHLGIQGYYNPFTGEAQVNKYLPSFMLPFVICHEMAHQSGIASEEDANLLAYAICSQVPDVAYNYSAYFNLWLYTHARLKASDTATAHHIADQLNPLSQEHLSILRSIREKYHSPFQIWSAEIYDSFLKMNHQKEGLKAYGNVVYSAWMLEEKRKHEDPLVLRLP